MALDPLKHPAIFLSASIPLAERDARYYESADVIAVRECIKALVSVMVPRYVVVWGGHPSITPLIRLLAEARPGDVIDYFVLYQSKAFQSIAPKDNEFFRHVIWVNGAHNERASLDRMRQRMIDEPNYFAAFFVGGMEGIENEFSEFRKAH